VSNAAKSSSTKSRLVNASSGQNHRSELPQSLRGEVIEPAVLKDWNYEQTVREIEGMIARIESGELELAAVFEQFSQAVERLRQCEQFLAERHQQMDLLIETLTDDPLV
jgi:exodeoxyribonuclease VII small subunit